jgi:hypothetical protein
MSGDAYTDSLPRSEERYAGGLPRSGEPSLFLAERRPDGTYTVTLTEDGIETFETALAIARDLGSNTRISTQSTIADIMERTATREELSRVLRRGEGGRVRQARVIALERQLRGSEEPSPVERTIGHLGKLIVIAVIALWTFQQFAIAIGDVEAIPGILAGIPNDILHLHPTDAFGEVGNRIADFGTHVLYGILGACLTYVVAKLIRPFGRIYRRDQILPGERPFMDLVTMALRRADRGRVGAP